MGASGRKRWLLAFQDWMLDNAESITDLVQAESGKATAEALLEPTMSADIVGYWARNAAGFLAESHPKPHTPLMKIKRLTTVHRPVSRSGADHSVEFPVHERGGRRGACPRCRRRAAAQAIGGDAAVRRRVRARLGRNRRAPGTRVGARLCRDGRRGDRELRLRAVHRFDGYGPQGRRSLRGTVDPVQPRTRRQGPGDRARRRRPGTRRQRHRVGRHAQFRPGLRIRRTGLRRGPGVRPVRRHAHRQGESTAPGGRRPSLPVRCRRHGHRRTARQGRPPRRRSGRRRCPGHHRRQAGNQRNLLRANGARRRRPIDEPV